MASEQEHGDANTWYSRTIIWLYVFSILTASSQLIELELTENSSFLPIKIQNSQTVDLTYLLSGVTLLLTIRTMMKWSDLPISRQKNTFAIFDHSIAISLSVFTLSWINIENNPFNISSLGLILYTAIIILFMISFFHKMSLLPAAFDRIADFLYWGRERDETNLKNLILMTPYRLFYNPDFPSQSKLMEFLPNGMIDRGKNKNENSWSIEKQNLVIKSADGKAFSKFYFSKRRLCWISTNNIRLPSLKNQYMLVDGEYSNQTIIAHS